MEVIFFYENGKTEVVNDIIKIEDHDSDVIIITRKKQFNGSTYEVGILKSLVPVIKIRCWKKHKVGLI